jgi:hypothetical protein
MQQQIPQLPQQLQQAALEGVRLESPFIQQQRQLKSQLTGESVQAPSFSNSTLHDTPSSYCTAAQIVTGLNGAGLEEERTVAITKIAVSFIKQTGH